MKNTLACLFLLSTFLPFAVQAQSAKDLQGIPLYESFTRDDARAKDLKNLISRSATEQNVRSVTGFDFESQSALVEEVIRWYAEKLNVSSLLTEEAIVQRDRDMVIMVGSGMSRDKLVEQGKPGGVSQVTLRLTQPQLQARESYDEDFAWKNEQYKKTHKPIAGQFSNGANFLWSKMEANGDVTDCAIIISDWSIDARQKVYQQRIKLRITFVTKQSQKAATVAQKSKTAEQTPAAIPSGEPTAEYLGIPIFPGAKFNERDSKMAQAQGAAYFSWASNDPVDKIVDFYEKATGLKRTAVDSGGYSITKQFTRGGGAIVSVFPTKGAPTKDPMFLAANSAIMIVKF
jgi:predicted esterase